MALHEVFVTEHRPVRERNLAADDWEFITDHPTIAKGAAVDVDHPGDTVGPGVDRAVRDRPAATVSDQDDRVRHGVDESDNSIDVITQADAFPVRTLRLETGKGGCVNRVAGFAKWSGDIIPARAIQPESRD